MDVYRYAMTLGVPSHLAQEITQDVFIRLYESLRAGIVVEHARAWLLRATHNAAMNAVTARGYSAEPLETAGPVAIHAGTEERLIEEERRRRLEREISLLSTQQRACLELRAQGLRYHEIGEVLAIGTSTVGEFLRRAIERLRKALDE
jgi:RNA polymerase sigma-70 factor (ECF subfamily)